MNITKNVRIPRSIAGIRIEVIVEMMDRHEAEEYRDLLDKIEILQYARIPNERTRAFVHLLRLQFKPAKQAWSVVVYERARLNRNRRLVIDLLEKVLREPSRQFIDIE